jgi:hypothetical protein
MSDVPTGDLHGKDIQDDLLHACGVVAMSPRAIDKRARPGNEAHRTTVPPGDLAALDEDPSIDPEVATPVDPTESAHQN